ncbi:MAG: ATP-binding protein [Candidatus Uhrbacteria bacterium]|nr:ATP-binding protein [Candidatus Uhrbacteria bacterium]
MGMINLQNIILVFSWVATFLLGFFVIKQNPKKIINISFFTFIIAIIVWGIANYFSNITEIPSSAVLWSKITFIGPYWIPALLLIFVLRFTDRVKKISIKLYSLVLIIPILLSSLSFTSFIVAGSVSYKPVKLEYGIGYPFFGFYLLVFFSLAFYFLIKAYRHSFGIIKLRIRYFFLGVFISAILGLLFNLVFPVILKRSEFTDYGPISTIIFIGFTTYAIIRHRLLDIRVVISRSIIYFFLIVFVTLAFTTTTFITGLLIQQLGGSQLLTTILVSLIIVFGFDPLKNLLARITDAIFFKGVIDYNEAVRQMTNLISVKIDLLDLLQSVDGKLQELLKIKKARVLLRTKDKELFSEYPGNSGQPGAALPVKNELAKFLIRTNKIVVFEELERKITDTTDDKERMVLEKSRDEIEGLNAAVVAPIILEGDVNGLFVLGGKRSGDVYSNNDLEILETLGPLMGSAIEKSRLYDEVKSFGEKMKGEVKAATAELQGANVKLKNQNVYLSALQNIANIITRSLDFQKVTQTIADGIAKELGYIGGIIILKQGDKTFPAAVTSTALTKAALKLLPKKLPEFNGSIDDPDLSAESMRTGTMQISESLIDFLNPPIPKPVCLAIQKLVGAKSIISVPIFSEEEIIGCIVYVTQKSKKDLSEDEISMMESLADQMGIVTRNVKLVEELRHTNDKMEQANEHLKELDEAKNEFISIASHQLRTPLTGIKGYLAMIVDGDFGKVPKQQNEILTQVLEASKRMIRLVNLFLNITKIEAGKFTLEKKPTNMAELIQTEINEVITVAEEKGLKVKFQTPKKEVEPIIVDGDKLKDVVLNLVDNAIKYTENGSVTVKLSQEANGVRVEVHDTGRGIPKEETDKLFSKFVRGEGIAQVQPDGSGLGLYIAKRIVDAHKGDIWVESEGLGKGSTFIFTLPGK